MPGQPATAVDDVLFADPALNVYAVLDGASVPGLRGRLHADAPAHSCLISGPLKPDVAQTAPYVVRLEPAAPFTTWVLGEGWGRHWGLFAVSPAVLTDVRRHLRTLRMVRLPDGRAVHFRHYDPRVMRIYLPTCNAAERRQVFGPITALFLEGPDGAVLRFGSRSARADRIPIAAAPGRPPMATGGQR